MTITCTRSVYNAKHAAFPQMELRGLCSLRSAGSSLNGTVALGSLIKVNTQIVAGKVRKDSIPSSASCPAAVQLLPGPRAQPCQ
jgi:hypothetical protein